MVVKVENVILLNSSSKMSGQAKPEVSVITEITSVKYSRRCPTSDIVTMSEESVVPRIIDDDKALLKVDRHYFNVYEET